MEVGRPAVKVALYARVSTAGQDPEIVEEFVDRGFSGARERRPALDRLMRAAWSGHFRAVLVWRFDRFARSVKHLVTALETFRTIQVDFISLQEQFDTATPIGQAMFTIIGTMAQLERDIVQERVTAGLERARARGKKLGRPCVPVDIETIRRLRLDGHSLGAIARRVRCSRATLRRRLREAGALLGADAP